MTWIARNGVYSLQSLNYERLRMHVLYRSSTPATCQLVCNVRPGYSLEVQVRRSHRSTFCSKRAVCRLTFAPLPSCQVCEMVALAYLQIFRSGMVNIVPEDSRMASGDPELCDRVRLLDRTCR